MTGIRVVGLVVALAAVWSCGDDAGVQIIECSGTCTCDQEARACTCQGGTTCALSGSDDDVALTCAGNAHCAMSCGDRCEAVCEGTSGCSVELGAGSSATCQGTGVCDFTCHGDCEVACPGTSSCVVRCDAGATCSLSGCPPQSLIDCGNGVRACRSACTTPS